MQVGSVIRHGRGWRGHWTENGKRRATATFAKKGEARSALNREIDRLALGDAYRPPITLRELADRFLAQHVAAPQTITYARRRLVRPLAAFGDAQAGDVTPEAIQRLLADIPGKNWRHDILRTLRMTYRFGVTNKLVDKNPAALVKSSQPVRGENILPLSVDEVDRVAAEAGKWGPLIVFMADTGARPSEAVAVEWRHVDLDRKRVELPGQKTDGSWRTVHMTSRGVDAIRAMPRSIATRRLFHIEGRPVSFNYFRREVWHPALEACGLEARAPYCLRHSYALHCLQAGVPIATLARQMGHSDVSRTYKTYGGWVTEIGEDAAALRETWAASTTSGEVAQ